MSSPRVISLISSATEILHGLGCGSLQVGKSHECDYPASIADLPVCTEPKFPTDGTSYEIDQRVKAIVQEGLSVYRVFADKLDQLQPDLILTQTQCEVCAVSETDVIEAVQQMTSSRPKVVSLETMRLDDLWADIQRVADALDHSAAGVKLVSELKNRIQVIEEKLSGSESRPGVAVIEWIEPLMSGGNWMPELVSLAGGEPLFGEVGKHSPFMTFQQLVESDPEIIVVTPCGWGIDKSLSEMGPLTSAPGWRDLKAVKGGRVFICDGNHYFNRPGPRLVESLEIMAEICHPDIFNFSHRGTGYRVLNSD